MKLCSWLPTSDRQLEEAEHLLLRHLEFTQRNVAGLNTISHESNRDLTIVMIHGFAGGLAHFVPCWAELSRVANVHAIDLPGFGRSTRPERAFPTEHSAIDFFMDYLSRWFDAMMFCSPVMIIAHSFGGYVASHFAVRRPALVRSLLLVDVWGAARFVEGDYTMPLRFKIALWFFNHFTPLSPLRAIGPLGPRVVRKVRPDMGRSWEAIMGSPKAFFDYTYHCICNGYPTGELAFQACVRGPLFAKTPLLEVFYASLPRGLSINFIVGAESWVAHPRELIDVLVQQGLETELHVVSSGHQVISENPQGFVEAVMQVISREEGPVLVVDDSPPAVRGRSHHRPRRPTPDPCPPTGR